MKIVQYQEKPGLLKRRLIPPQKSPKQNGSHSPDIFHLRHCHLPLIKQILVSLDQALVHCSCPDVRWSTICSATTTSSPVKRNQEYFIFRDTNFPLQI